MQGYIQLQLEFMSWMEESWWERSIHMKKVPDMKKATFHEERNDMTK